MSTFPPKQRFIPLFLAFSILAACLCACKGPEKKTGAGNAGKEETTLTPVVCRLKWLFNVSVAGELWALETGLFKKQGLKVELREGGPEQDAIKDLELGRADFGVASADQVLRAVDKGADIVVLAQIFQINPLQWIYDASKRHIHDPSQLKRLTVGITYGGNDEAIFMALMKRYHLTEKDLNLYAVHYDYNPFWKGEVDLWPVYRNVEGIILTRKMAKHGNKAAFFDPNEHGIRFVANSLITSRKFYLNNKDIVHRFTNAVTKGWKLAMLQSNEKKALDIIHKYDRDTPKEIIIKQIKATRAMIIPKDGGAVGGINSDAWRQTAGIMLSQEIIKNPVDVSSLLAPPPPQEN
jgi:NitT/TauT family transport system substrate-binding protein